MPFAFFVLAFMTVNQWVPAAHKGDAIGDSARRVRGLLRELGHESEIYALTVDDDLRKDIRAFVDPSSRRGDMTIFHYALPSPMTDAFARLPRGRVLHYHNVTPARFFAPYDAGVFRLAALGRQELETLVGQTDAALGDSEYNRQACGQTCMRNTTCHFGSDVIKVRSLPANDRAQAYDCIKLPRFTKP